MGIGKSGKGMILGVTIWDSWLAGCIFDFICPCCGSGFSVLSCLKMGQYYVQYQRDRGR